MTYGLRAGATLVPADVVIESDGSGFNVEGQPYRVPLPGRFNVSNALAAIAIARLMGVDDATGARGLRGLERVPGRMERCTATASTSWSITRTRPTRWRARCARCAKRREDAHRRVRLRRRSRSRQTAGNGSHRRTPCRPIYLTNDNPRSEDARRSSMRLHRGIGDTATTRHRTRSPPSDRTCHRRSGTGDVVLIAGKGHERYQIVGDRVLAFDDAAVARAALARRARASMSVAARDGGRRDGRDALRRSCAHRRRCALHRHAHAAARRYVPGAARRTLRRARLCRRKPCTRGAALMVARSRGGARRRGRASVVVGDTTHAYHGACAAARDGVRGTVLAITGSAGKDDDKRLCSRTPAGAVRRARARSAGQ